MDNHLQLVVAIPVFRKPALWYEIASVQQAIKQLYAYDHALIVPSGFDVTEMVALYHAAQKAVTIHTFDSAYFESVYTYNKLMLSVGFYRTFSNYRYLLICQTDVWVFSNRLHEWLQKDFDYVGAPWINNPFSSWYAKEKNTATRVAWKLGRRYFNAVGNGGCSLRKIETICLVLTKYALNAQTYANNEDFFFAFEVPKHHGSFKIPTVKQALGFAFDEQPSDSFQLAKQQLPMAAHSWWRFPAFWQRFIPVEWQ